MDLPFSLRRIAVRLLKIFILYLSCIEEKINSFIVKFIGKLFKCLLYVVNVLRRSIWFIWKGN